MKIIVDSDIGLELLAPKHTQALFALTDANRLYLRQWLPWLDSVITATDTAAFINATHKKFAQQGAANFAVLVNGQVCGVVGFNDVNAREQTGAIGYWLAQASQGQGIMTRAVKALLQFGFANLKLHALEINVALGNHKSRALAERLGFTLSGKKLQCEWLYNRFVDHAVYRLRREDYAPD